MNLEKCPHCGVIVQTRHDEEHKLLDPDNKGTWSIWHGDYDGGCPGRFVHHMWFSTEEAAIFNWYNYCRAAQTDSEKSVVKYITNDAINSKLALDFYNKSLKESKAEIVPTAYLYSMWSGRPVVYKGSVTGGFNGGQARFHSYKKSHQCSINEGELFNSVVWFIDRNDERAKKLLITYEEQMIRREELKIFKHKGLIDNIKNMDFITF